MSEVDSSVLKDTEVIKENKTRENHEIFFFNNIEGSGIYIVSSGSVDYW